MVETLSALGVVLGALVLLRVLLGWLQPGMHGPAGRLRVVETCALSSRQRLHVVEVEGERLLIASAEGQIRLLRRLAAHPKDAEASAPVAASASSPEAASGTPRSAERLRAWLRQLATVMGSFIFTFTFTLGLVMLAAEPASAQLLEGIDLGSAMEPDRISSTLEIVALLTAVSIAPSLLLMGTCFTRIVIVLSLLRQAIGVNQLPPSQVLVGLALFLTVYAMAPVGDRVHTEALGPYIDRKIDAQEALGRAEAPVREFMLRHTREKDLALFAEISGQTQLASPDQIGMAALLPSYMISELRTAFEIGFMLFLPFLVIDLVVASMLISMGMIVLPPIVISFPFKLMLFVLLDGWHLMVRSLMSGLV